MSTVDTTSQPVSPAPIPSAAPIVLEKAAVRNWKPPIGLGVFAIIGVLIFIVGGRPGTSTFKLSTDSDLIQLPPILANVTVVTTVVVVLLFLLALFSAFLSYRARKTPLWVLAVFALLFLAAFLTWAAAGATIPIPGVVKTPRTPVTAARKAEVSK